MKTTIELEPIKKEEQETVISRLRDEDNLLRIYSSDSRVIRRILIMGLADTRIRVSTDTKKVAAIECTLDIKEFLKTAFLPIHRPKKRV